MGESLSPRSYFVMFGRSAWQKVTNLLTKNEAGTNSTAWYIHAMLQLPRGEADARAR